MKFKKNILLAPLSTFRIGARAEYFCLVKRPENLVEAVKWAERHRMPYKIFASGSNVVFPDTKLKGLLVQLRGGELEVRGSKMCVDAGVSLASVIKRSIASGLKGLETLSGIPGSIGGAVFGNAGAYGHSISEVVEKVEIWDGTCRRWLTNKGCRFKYRESVFSSQSVLPRRIRLGRRSARGGKGKPYILLRVVLKFKKGKPSALKKTSRDIITLRLKKYKPRLRCPGSFFKNVLVKDVSKRALARINRSKIIEGKIPTGYLLEEVGAKGIRVGGVEIADFHGNLFINRGRGTARDVERLARVLKDRVKKRFGIELEEEIRYF